MTIAIRCPRNHQCVRLTLDDVGRVTTIDCNDYNAALLYCDNVVPVIAELAAAIEETILRQRGEFEALQVLEHVKEQGVCLFRRDHVVTQEVRDLIAQLRRDAACD